MSARDEKEKKLSKGRHLLYQRWQKISDHCKSCQKISDHCKSCQKISDHCTHKANRINKATSVLESKV